MSRARTRFGLGPFDLDQDGELDLLESNGRVTRPPRTTTGDSRAEESLLLRGLPGFAFREPFDAFGGAPPATSRVAAFGDVDGDAAIDVLLVNRDAPAQLLLHRSPNRGHWLIVDVRDEHGASALGATVTVTAGARTWRSDIRAAGSYLATITQPAVIRAVLGCIGLPARAPPLAPARPLVQPELDFGAW